MKTNELRIGNWVQYDGTPYQIESLTKVDAVVRRKGIFDFDNRSIEKAQPIELTEEVLLTIGFKKNIIYGSTIEYLPINNDLVSVFCTKEKQNIKIQIVCKNTTETIVKYIKYLHQLQNAYYCLTNEELNIEL